MGNNSSKTAIEIKNTPCDIKTKNLNHKNNKTDKNNENNNDKDTTNDGKEKKAKDRDKKLSKEKRKHYLNRLTFINRRESFVENNFIPRNSFGACSYYDENNNLFEYEPDFSNNFENFKFSNSFVDDYNPNNEYINNYLNSHRINESSNLNTSSINFVKERKSQIQKTNSIGMRNSLSEDNLVLINGVKKLNKGNLHFEYFDYGNNIDNNINGVNNYNDSNYICDRSRRNSGLKNNFNFQEARTTFGYEYSEKRHSMSNTDLNSFKGIYNDNYFENSFIEKQSHRKHRKTIISNLINNSLALRKNYEKEEKSLNSISPNDSLNEHIINNAQIFSSKHEDNKIFEEKLNSKVKIEENAFSYAETRNSLFLDLKNQEFFFDNQSSNNLANNSYSDIRSTSDTKLFDIAKPRAKTPNREVKTCESDISIINSNKSETKTIDFLSKSYEVFDINKKQEDVFSSEISMENISDKDNSSFDKNCKKSISFEYEKVNKTNSINKSNFEVKEDLNNIGLFSDKIAKIKEASHNFKSSEYLKQRKYYSNINIAQVKSTKEFLLNNKNINSLIDKNNSSNDIMTNYKNELNSSNGETNHHQPFRFRKSIISNLHALNNSSNNIYNNLNKNTVKLELNNLNNSYFYSSNRTIKSNSDNSIVNNSDTNSTSFRMTIGNNSTFNNHSIQNNHNISKFSNEESYGEYKLNFYRVKHSENLRKNYIAKLIYKQIWQPSKKEKNHNSLILFDWDDTLLCTSFLTPNGVYREDLKLSDKDLEKLAKLEFSVLRLLTIAVEKGDVYIITNAATGWVEYSAEKYYPSLKTIIKKIKIVSARGEHEKEYPGDSRMWKIQAFLNMQKDFDPGLITNIICLGDSFIEMEAAQILAGKFSKAFIKSVKFRESPKPEELNKQLTLVADQFLSIYSTIKNLTIRVERKLRK